MVIDASMYFQDTRPEGNRPTAQIPVSPAAPPGATTNPPGWPTQAEADLAVQHGWSGGYMGGPGNHRKKNRAGLWVGLAVAGVLVMCGILGVAAFAGAGDQEPKESFTSMPVQAPDAKKAQPSAATGEKKAETKKAVPAVPGIGAKVTIEDLQYQVHGVKCGLVQVGPKDFGASAQGQFCRVDMSVTNLGGDPKIWDANYNVKARDAKGREFSADSTAGIFGNVNNGGWLDEINPGNTVRAFVFFDLPKGVKAVKLEVSSGLIGDSADIKL